MTPLEIANEAYKEYYQRLSLGCDCDFHVGNWTAAGFYDGHLNPTKYAQPGDTLVKVNGSYCNHPNRNAAPTGLSMWLPKDPIPFGLNREQKPCSAVITKTGHTCSSCNEYNDYAAANKPNGTYVCYKCR